MIPRRNQECPRRLRCSPGMRKFMTVFLAGVVLTGIAVAEDLPKPNPALPDEFKQLIPRGYIPAIDDPKFVTAAEAEIDDEAWVLGVAIDGQAKAYSLNLLNRHEVVNDRIGDRPIAAVW